MDQYSAWFHITHLLTLTHTHARTRKHTHIYSSLILIFFLYFIYWLKTCIETITCLYTCLSFPRAAQLHFVFNCSATIITCQYWSILLGPIFRHFIMDWPVHNHNDSKIYSLLFLAQIPEHVGKERSLLKDTVWMSFAVIDKFSFLLSTQLAFWNNSVTHKLGN